MDAATRNKCWTTVAGVMRISADDDNQADQQHEIADPGMAETDHTVLNTP